MKDIKQEEKERHLRNWQCTENDGKTWFPSNQKKNQNQINLFLKLQQ